MYIKQPKVWRSHLLNGLPGLTHGYSTRLLGDMRRGANQQVFLSHLSLGGNPWVRGEQIHGSSVGTLTQTQQGVIPRVDGIVSRVSVSLGVIVADCVPLLMADIRRGIVAAVHAGWRGTLAGISTTAVDHMKGEGSSPADIFVSVGPHIGACCYTVSKERIDAFESVFGHDTKMTGFDGNAWHLDIGWANVRQLKEAGIAGEHIDAPAVCTSCQSDIFYSYRKDSKDTFGEILGVIALTNQVNQL